MPVLLWGAYVVLGLIQLFAIQAAFSSLLGVGQIVGLILAFLATWFPLVGTGLGIWGAVAVWNWSILAAILLFGWHVVLAFAIAMTRRQARRRA
ncbi:MAG: hypothetical protein VYB54_11590 [Pseudomonadota bacterium]|nr:hypothetical protein [Pseudomonadota bacterium]